MAVEYIGNQIKRLKKECYLEENMINRLGLVDEITEWADYLINYLNHEFKMNIDPREGLYLYILLKVALYMLLLRNNRLMLYTIF